MRLNIALDLEGVLADTHAAVAKRSDMLNASLCPPDNWDFPTSEHKDEFLHVSQNLWHNHEHKILPTEDDIGRAVRRLSRNHHVDIVTHRANVDEQIEAWLYGYNVPYENLVVAKGHKSDAGDYDVYIDDSPKVAKDIVMNNRFMLLYDKPYNQSYDAKALRRVSSVTEAAEFCNDPDTVAAIQRAVRGTGLDTERLMDGRADTEAARAARR